MSSMKKVNYFPDVVSDWDCKVIDLFYERQRNVQLKRNNARMRPPNGHGLEHIENWIAKE